MWWVLGLSRAYLPSWNTFVIIWFSVHWELCYFFLKLLFIIPICRTKIKGWSFQYSGRCENTTFNYRFKREGNLFHLNIAQQSRRRGTPPWLLGLVCHLSSLRDFVWQSAFASRLRDFHLSSCSSSIDFCPVGTMASITRHKGSSRQMFTRPMILSVSSSLMTVIPKISYNLPERLSVLLKVAESHLWDPTFRHKRT